MYRRGEIEWSVGINNLNVECFFVNLDFKEINGKVTIEMSFAFVET